MTSECAGTGPIGQIGASLHRERRPSGQSFVDVNVQFDISRWCLCRFGENTFRLTPMLDDFYGTQCSNDPDLGRANGANRSMTFLATSSRRVNCDRFM